MRTSWTGRQAGTLGIATANVLWLYQMLQAKPFIPEYKFKNTSVGGGTRANFNFESESVFKLNCNSTPHMKFKFSMEAKEVEYGSLGGINTDEGGRQEAVYLPSNWNRPPLKMSLLPSLMNGTISSSPFFLVNVLHFFLQTYPSMVCFHGDPYRRTVQWWWGNRQTSRRVLAGIQE